MKKIVLLLSFLVFFAQNVFGLEEQYYCPKEPYSISGGIGGFFSSITGTNIFLTKFAQKEIAKSLNKELNGKFKVNIDTFGGNNLQNGRFKTLTAKSKNIENNGMYFSDLTIQTLCDFNHIKYENKKVYFVENMVLGYESKVSANDLKRTIQSQEYLKAVNKLAITSKGKAIAKIMNHDVEIKNNRIVMSYDVFVPFFLGTIPKHIEFSADIKVENGKVIFADIDFGNSLANDIMKSTIPMIKLLNPFVYQVEINKEDNAIINVKKAEIVNNEILINGVVIIPKNYIEEGK